MYITLSSKNEASNSRFTNKFLDNIVIKEGSSIALVGATINQATTADIMIIPANTYIYLRTNGVNIIRFQPNTVDKQYTQSEFVNRMNALVALNKPYGININFRVDGKNIAIDIYAEDDFDYNIDFMDYVWGGNVRPQVFNPAYESGAASTYPTFQNIMASTGTTADQEPIQFQTTTSIGVPEQYSYPVTGGKQLTRDTANASRAFDRARVFDYHDDLENHIYDSFGIVTGPQNDVAPHESADNRWVVNWGHSTYDRSLNAYTKVPLNIIAADSSNFKESLKLNGDYSLSLDIWNSDTNSFDTTTGNYLPGDVIQHFLTNTADTPPAPNISALYNPLWRQLQYKGLMYWFPMSLNNIPDAVDRQYNSLRIEHEEANNFLQNQADVPQTGNFLLTAMGYSNTSKTSCNRVIGVGSGFGQNNANTNLNNITPQYLSYVTGEIERNTTETESYFNNLPNLKRRNSADGLGAEQNKQDRIELTAGVITSGESSAYQIFCIPEDDSAYNNAGLQYTICLLGGKHDDGTETPILYLTMNQSTATDIRIASKNSAQLDQNLTLLDGTGTRINPQWGNRYGVCVTYTRGDTKLKATVWEINADYSTATPYSAEATLSTGIYEGLPNVTCIGGIASGQGAASVASLRAMSGTIGHFRLYNFTASTTETTIPSDSVGTQFTAAIGEQWTSNFRSTIVNCVPVKNNLFDSTDRKYAVIGSGGQPNNDDESETNNYCPAFMNEPNLTANRTVNPLYPDLVDVFCLPNVNIKYADNFEGVNNLDITAYTGTGSGIVLTDSYSSFLGVPNEDVRNQREIAPYTWYEPGDANPYAEIEINEKSSEDEAQVLRINIDNLPIRTFNGTTGNISKCIYELQSDADQDIRDNKKTMTKTIPEKVRVPLNNAGQIVMNSFDVVIMDQDEKEVSDLVDHTSITVEII